MSLIFCYFRPEPQYIHTPSIELNSRLNLIVALTLACVLGLGVGHFLGKNQYNYSMMTQYTSYKFILQIH